MLIATSVSANILNAPTTYKRATVEEIKPIEMTPELQLIAKCESSMRQFNEDGSVLRGIVNPKDVGILQINEDYHLATSQSLGYDIYTLEGNVAYGKWLIERQGYKPWIHSNPCHRLLG